MLTVLRQPLTVAQIFSDAIALIDPGVLIVLQGEDHLIQMLIGNLCKATPAMRIN